MPPRQKPRAQRVKSKTAVKRVIQKHKPQKRVQKKCSPAELCVAQYAVARMRPFSARTFQACIPGANATPSFKFTTRRYVPISLNTTGGVTVLYQPNCSDDVASMYYAVGSPTATLGATYTAAVAASGTSVAIGSPFPAASFVAGALESRLVGAAIRFTPSGAELYRQGIAFGYFTPSVPATLAYGSTIASFSALYNTRHVVLTDEAQQLEVRYDTEDYLANEDWNASCRMAGQTQVSATNGPPAVLYIPCDAAGTSAVTGVLESIEHWEVRGNTVAPFASPNESVVGLASRVAATASEIERTEGPSPHSTAVSLTHMLQGLNKHLPKGIVNVARSLLSDTGEMAGIPPAVMSSPLATEFVYAEPFIMAAAL